MAWDLLQYIAKEFIVRQVAEVNWCKVCVRWLGLITAHKFDSPSPLTLLSSFLWDALYFLATALIIELQCCCTTCICFGFLSPLRSEVSWFVQIPNWIFSPKGSDLLQSWESLSPWMEWVTLNPYQRWSGTLLYWYQKIFLYLCRVTKIPTYADPAGS